MSDLAAWLRAQLDEDERVARVASPGPWRVDSETYAEAIYGASDEAVIAGGRWGGEASVFDSTADAIHIARHDPARVLAEVAAKRKILELHPAAGLLSAPDLCGSCAAYPGPCDTLRLLALPYAGMRGWREEWRV